MVSTCSSLSSGVCCSIFVGSSVVAAVVCCLPFFLALRFSRFFAAASFLTCSRDFSDSISFNRLFAALLASAACRSLAEIIKSIHV